MAPTRDPRTTEWFSSQRGISPETLDAFGIGSPDGGGSGRFGATFPYSNATKVRPDMSDRMRYWDPALGRDDLRLFGEALAPTEPRVVFLVEGESDTMALYQHVRGAGKGESAAVLGLPGVETWRDEHREVVGDVDTVYVVLDNDDPYENPQAVGSVDRGWARIKGSLGRRAVRVKLPPGVKDVCEFFKAYDYAAFAHLCRTTPRASWHWSPVDFTQPVPERDWLLDEVLHHKAFNLVVGDPGMGKSFLTMALAVALLEGWPTLLNRPVKHHGRVYYIDEENPLDIVLQRMSRLGLTEKGRDPDRLRYMHNTGLDFDEQWDLVHDEILQFEPTLVVVDSLSEVTAVEENSKTEMAAVLARLKSITRNMDATVALIHHANVDKGRARGSGHIRAATDAEWWVGSSDKDDSLLRMVCRKHRHGIARGTTVGFRIDDEFGPEGEPRIVLKPTGGDREEPF